MNQLPITYWLTVALTIATLALSQILFSRLEKHHRITFEKLGSPHLFANNTPYNNWLYNRWLFSAEALQLDDTVSSMVWTLRACVLIVLASFFWHVATML